MAKYIVKLSEQEELNLRQLTLQPGFDSLLKLLQGESLDAQSAAMECKSLKMEERAMAQMQAQVAVEIIGNLTRKVCAYREALVAPQPVDSEDELGLIANLWEKERAN